MHLLPLPEHRDHLHEPARRHLRLQRRYGSADAYDAVLTGFLFCAHLWPNQPETTTDAWHQWTRRTQLLIPIGAEAGTFSASRLFASVYPEAVSLAAVIASPAWRLRASGDTGLQRQSPPRSGDGSAGCTTSRQTAATPLRTG